MPKGLRRSLFLGLGLIALLVVGLVTGVIGTPGWLGREDGGDPPDEPAREDVEKQSPGSAPILLGRASGSPDEGKSEESSTQVEGRDLTGRSLDSTAASDDSLEAGAILIGRVVSASGKPIAGARLVCAGKVDRSTPSSPAKGVEGVSEEDGSFRLPPAPAGASLALVIRARGHGFLTRALAAERLSAGDVDLGDIVLPESRYVGGIVTEADGTAVPRVRVHIGRLTRTPLYRHEGESYAFGTQDECWTDELGRFRFVDLMPGPFRVRVEPHDQDAISKDVHVPDDEDLEDLHLILPHARSLRVVVETAEGAPLPGVMANLWPGPGIPARRARTDSDGVARFKLTGSAQSVTLQLPRGLRGTYIGVLSRKLDVADRELRFVLHEGLATRGRVIDQNSQARGGIYVYVHIDGEEADSRVAAADGTFEVTVPAGPRTDLVVTGWANVPMEGGGTRGARLPVAGRLDQVRAGAQNLVLPVFTKDVDRTLHIRVVLPSGEPAPGALVVYMPGPNGGFGHVTTDEEGRARIEDLAAVPLKLTARFFSKDLPNVGAHAEDVVPADQEVVLQIETGTELTGWVLDASHRPLFSIEVSVKCASGTTHMTKSGPDGSFRFRLGPQDGELVTVEAVHTTEDGRHLSGTLKNVSRASQDLRLVLDPPDGR